MDKKIAGLLGAVAALTSLDAAQAATQSAPNPSEGMRAASYSDLLTPISNAVAVLRADDEALARRSTNESADGVQVAQIFYHHHHHHHHYHSQYMANPRRDA